MSKNLAEKLNMDGQRKPKEPSEAHLCTFWVLIVDYHAWLWWMEHKQDCLQQPAGADNCVGTIRGQLSGVQQQHASLSAKIVNLSSTSLDEVGHCSRRSSVL
ncbi:hypothetical protein CAPTEDRAFT_209341 [Capitella teleta]|uniref:Uncharacterized protein n=1 Tax=Capitella teleta TaxID=283909 RepID=R7TE28_CAPTE|nr:hypothetical protein CAPTEDRAFT_209341 [Capitella teleta]|eukprot:ELT92018.1 hypothetical protein CAPTEDRAFT_209341 [Capitella teleta]